MPVGACMNIAGRVSPAASAHIHYTSGTPSASSVRAYNIYYTDSECPYEYNDSASFI
jgi:hypothetical protein